MYAVVFLAALFSRLYRLGWHLLWVDEIYSVNLSQMGLAAILENSNYEPISPLFYLLLKAATLFGTFTSEGNVRLVSALAGTAAIVLLYHLARRTVGHPAALAGTVFLLLSPSLMFYSQETRSYMLGMLAATVSTFLVLRLSNRSEDHRKAWAAWGLASVLGVYSLYSYFFVLAVQVIYLFWLHRFRRRFTAALALVAALCLPTLAWLGPQVVNRLGDAQRGALTLTWTLQALVAADPARYGTFWGTTVMAWTFSGAGLLGLVRLAKTRIRFGYYLLAQILLPLLGFFLVGGALRLHLPNYQSRQFLVLFPAVFIWALYGLDWAYRRLPPQGGAGLLLAVSLVWGAAGWAGLEQYWLQDKSPEGRTVIALAQRLESGDAIVSLHHSTSYALGRNLPDWPLVFAFPQQIGRDWYFDENRFFLGANFFPDARFTLETVREQPRIWLLYHRAGSTVLLDLLAQGCDRQEMPARKPFVLNLISECMP